MAGSIVQQWGAEAAAAGTTLTTGSATVTAGNFLVIQTNSDTNVTCTITKNAGTATIGAITERTSVTEAATLETTKTYTCSITGSGTLDLLATFGASDANRMHFAWEISGVDAYFGSQAQTDTGSNPTPTCTVTVATAPAFAMMLCIDVQGGTPSVGSGYTNYNTFGATVHVGRVQYKAVSSSGDVTGNFGNPGFDRNNSVLVVFTEPSPPVITVQPVQQTVASGATATFSVTATGATSYQWQINSAGTWANVNTGTGGTTSSYTTGTLGTSDNGNLYRCQVTNTAGTVNSAEVFVFLTNQPSAGKGERGYHSAWDVKTKRITGNIRQNSTQLIRSISRNGPNKDNLDLKTVWFNWFIPQPASTNPTGTLSVTLSNATLSSSGTTTIIGTLSSTINGDTLSANGTTTILGTLSRTLSDDTLAASGSPVIVGTLAITLNNDTLSASGSIGSPVTGTVAVTLGNDTLSSIGTTTIVGTFSRTLLNDTLSSQGTTTVLGSLAKTLLDDTLAAAGSVGSAVSGTLNVTLNSDTLSGQGTTTVLGSLSKILLNDTISGSGSVTITGILSVTLQNDILTASGSAGTPPTGVATKLPMTGVGS